MDVAPSGRAERTPLSFTLKQKQSNPDGWHQLSRLIERANDAGLPIGAQVLGRATSTLLGHQLTYIPFTASSTYIALSALPFAERITQLRRPEIRERILTEKPVRKVQISGAVWDFAHMFELSNPPNFEPDWSKA